jgi:hypothetical protein
MIRIAAFFLALGLSACADGMTDRASVAAEGFDGSSHDPGLLRDSRFEPESDSRPFAWVYTQHAGEESYKFEVEEGVLSITRIATQPWGQATQTVSAEGLEGVWVEFSAELSGSLVEPVRPELEPSGVGIRVLGFPPGTPRIIGKSILATEVGEPPIAVGELSWTRQALRLLVPEGATEIEVAIRLGLGGVLHARRPSLLVLRDEEVNAPQPAEESTDDAERQVGRGAVERIRHVEP